MKQRMLNMPVRNDAATSSNVVDEKCSQEAQSSACIYPGDESGQSLVEFALCLPILMLVATGIFVIGIAMNHYLIMTNAVNIGAQQLAISRGQTTDPCAITASAVKTASPTLVPANLSFTLVLNGSTYSGASCSSGSSTTGAAGQLVQGSAAQVTVTYPCSLLIYAHNLAPGGCTLKARTTELVQ
jgi:Flp pilus assembly protein TadG